MVRREFVIGAILLAVIVLSLAIQTTREEPSYASYPDDSLELVSERDLTDLTALTTSLVAQEGIPSEPLPIVAM